jgi:hypothetical protein
VSEALTESIQRLVLMEADLARVLESPDGGSGEPPADNFAELLARLIANQRQAIETLVLVAEEINALKAAVQRDAEGTSVA